MDLFYIDLYGRNQKIIVQLSDTIRTVKSKIKQKQNLDQDRQRIIFAGRQLEDQFTLQHYKIMPDTTFKLNLNVNIVKVFVKTEDNETIVVEVTSCTNADDIKKKINKETGIPVQNQTLLFQKNVLDERPVRSLGINEGDVIDLVKTGKKQPETEQK